jgi:hypothetical protein
MEATAAAWRRDRPGLLRFLVVGALSVIGLLANPWGAWVLAYAALLPANRVITGMVTEWAPASMRDPAGAMLLAAIGVLVVALARSRAHCRAPEQLLRMALLAGLALWAVRASVWFGLALPVAICALARERTPRPADADRGVALASGLVLAALAVAVAVVLPPIRRAMVPDGPPRPELTAAPVATAGWLAANPQPGRMFNLQPWGSYLEFRLGPQVKPAVDSRIELLPAERWHDCEGEQGRCARRRSRPGLTRGTTGVLPSGRSVDQFPRTPPGATSADGVTSEEPGLGPRRSTVRRLAVGAFPANHRAGRDDMASLPGVAHQVTVGSTVTRTSMSPPPWTTSEGCWGPSGCRPPPTARRSCCAGRPGWARCNALGSRARAASRLGSAAGCRNRVMRSWRSTAPTGKPAGAAASPTQWTPRPPPGPRWLARPPRPRRPTAPWRCCGCCGWRAARRSGPAARPPTSSTACW